MPFGGNDWLALTEEPSLEPEIPICSNMFNQRIGLSVEI